MKRDNFIKEYRKRHGYKQVELAKLLGVAQSTISRAEHVGSKKLNRVLFAYMQRNEFINAYVTTQKLVEKESIIRRFVNFIRKVFGK